MANPSLEAELQQAYDYFFQKNAQYDKVDACQAHIASLRQQKDAVALMRIMSKEFIALYVLVLIVVAQIHDRIVRPLLVVLYQLPIIGARLSEVLSWVFILLCFVLPFFLVRKGNWLYCKKRYADFAAEIKSEKAAMNVAYKALFAHYEDFSSHFGAPCALAFDYTDPDVITQIASYVQLGRADTLKEALNLLAADAQQAELLRTQQATLYAAQQAVVEAQNATRAAERAETAAWLS